jgi:hypothetical protein
MSPTTPTIAQEPAVMTVTMSPSTSLPRSNLVSAALAGALGVAALIHCLLMPDHFAASTIFGLGFLAAAIAQIGLAAVVLLRPRAWVYAAVIGLSVALSGLYAFNVAVGLPFHAAHTPGPPVVAAVDAHGEVNDHGAADDHHGAEHDRSGAADDHATTDADHGAANEHEAGGHGREGLAIGAGEPVDAWGATTQLAQVSSVGLALVLLRRRR